MKNPILLTLFSLLFSILTVHAQDNSNGFPISKHYIGLGAGFTTGFGISYRYVPQSFGIQINLAPYYDKNNNSFVSAGFTLLQSIKEAPDHRVFVYFANSLLYQKTISTGYNYNYPYNSSSTTSVSSVYNTGVGLDFQFFNFNSPFVFDLMGGLGGYNSFERFTFTGEFAIYYRI